VDVGWVKLTKPQWDLNRLKIGSPVKIGSQNPLIFSGKALRTALRKMLPKHLALLAFAVWHPRSKAGKQLYY